MMTDFETFCDRLDLKYSTEYRGFNKETKQFQWKVKINGETFDFYSGEEHVNEPPEQMMVRGYGVQKRPSNWRYDRSVFAEDFRAVWYASRAATKPPKLTTVLSCLVSDFEAGQMDFEDFCSAFGYDPDSRKAESTHRACCDNGMRLVRAVGLVKLAEIAEQSRNY